MKIVLKEEVYNVGLPGDVVDVADGFARNYLIPRGKALLATRGAMKEAEAMTRARKVREAATLDDAQAYKEAIEARTLRIPARVDDLGHLYGSVGSGDVHAVLKERGHDVDKRRIELKGTIKELGTYEIPVQIHPQVTATVTLEVVDVEGRIKPGGKVEVEVDADEVSDAAAEAAEGSETDVEVLAEQALQAARDFERQQAQAGGTEAGEPAPATQDTDVEGDHLAGEGPRGATGQEQDAAEV